MSELTPAHLHVPALPTALVGDGYDWIDALRFGWKTVPSWGLDMWDLGSWPLVIVVHLDDRRNGVFAVASYTEGDVELRAFTTRAERDATTGVIAADHWRLTGKGPSDLPPEGEPLLPHHKGLFTWDRFREEKDQLLTSKEENQ